MSGTVEDTLEARNAAIAATLAGTDTLATIRPRSSAPIIATPDTARFAFGPAIGEGGMAVVRSATQVALGREVAVKSLRDEAPSAADDLLREAWITGALEHPNIVPVHDLATDSRGQPMLVLKRIEGSPWSSSIRSKSLAWNLEQLVDVCHAVSFAHSRGILHRDLKPSNIMIGSFGEVYVLDWGIAVSLVDDGSGRVPLASAATDIAGTLAYMAPEMLGGAPLTERTDVYLLGAIIYEVLTGAPPHASASVTATLAKIAVSEPELPATAPEELAAICKRAMAREPADRYASAEELRVAIVGFMNHRGSAEVARTALDQLAALERHLATATVGDEADRVAAYQLCGQCRFGFHEALRTWPENAAARSGLDRALAAMASYELDHGDARAATVLIAELSQPVPALAERVVAVEAKAAEEARRVEALNRLGADQDQALGGGLRTVFIVAIGLIWAGAPLAAGLFPAIDVTHGMALAITSLGLAAIATFGYVARNALTRTAVNRGLLVTLFLAVLLHGVVEAAAWALGVDMVTTHMNAIVLWAGACGTAAVFLDRALLVPTLGFLAGWVAIVIAPPQRFWAIATSTSVFAMTALYIWYASKRGRRIAGLADLVKPRKTD